MNNKGFTLVELLAVIVILSGMSLVVVGSISSSLIKRDQKECEEQIELAKNAAKIYFSLNDVNEVCVKTLQDNNYFSGSKKIDRLIIENTSNCSNSKILIENNQYKYSNEVDKDDENYKSFLAKACK